MSALEIVFRYAKSYIMEHSAAQELDPALAELAEARAEVERLRINYEAQGEVLNSEIAALHAEVERLRGLVRAAYLEGWGEGNSVGVSQGQEWSGPHTKSDPEGDWEASDSRAAL